MRFYKVRWKQGSENWKKGVRNDMLTEEQYRMHRNSVELDEVCNDYEPVFRLGSGRHAHPAAMVFAS